MKKYAIVFHMGTISALCCNPETGEYMRVDLEDTEHYYPIEFFDSRMDARKALNSFCLKKCRPYTTAEIVTDHILKIYLAEDKLSRVA